MPLAVLGRGMFFTAVIFFESMAIPFTETVWPRKHTSSFAKEHCDGFSINPALMSFSSTIFTCVRWSAKALELICMYLDILRQMI